MVKSGFHKTSVGSETLLIPQKWSGCHWMCWLFQLCRDTAEFTTAKCWGCFMEYLRVCFKTHSHHPNIRDKGLVNLPLKTVRIWNICVFCWFDWMWFCVVKLHQQCEDTHHIQDGKELQLQWHSCRQLVVFDRPGHGKELVASAQLQVAQNILVAALCLRPITFYSWKYICIYFTYHSWQEKLIETDYFAIRHICKKKNQQANVDDEDTKAWSWQLFRLFFKPWKWQHLANFNLWNILS